MNRERIYLIYMYLSPNNKLYIGQTKNITKRRNQHKNSNKNYAFSNAINKYGFENFIEEILEENLTLDEANIREQYWIEFYNTLTPNGYNLQSGGLSYKTSEETKEKISESKKNPSEELRIINGNSMRGKHHTEESKIKISESQKGEKNNQFGKVGELSPNFGKVGDKSKCAKNYIIIFPDEHEEIVFGIKNFCRIMGLCSSSMIKVAQGIYKQHKGFKCRYVTDEEILV